MNNENFENLLENLKKETMFNNIGIEESSSYENNNSVDTKEKNERPVFEFKPRDELKGANKFNVIWSENKETLLFSILSSIIIVLLGLLSSYEYLVVAGSISFILFSVLIFITFFKYIFVAYQKSKVSEDLINRISVLERKIDFISKKDFSSGQTQRYGEIESEVKELKSVVKTIINSLKK